MAIPELIGHEELRGILAGAWSRGSLPHSMLLHGPAGAGKERLGLWLAQLILCQEATAEPCGRCQSCRLVLRLEHPDVHWFFPLSRPDASSAEKLREKLEEQRAAELQLWRDHPLRIPEFDKAPAHFIAAVRTIQQLATFRPAMGSHKVIVVGDAELMVPQEASEEAANAFLKLLEEPPPSTTVVLTSSQPGALLPTIRSRVFAIRVPPLPAEAISRLLVEGGLADAAKGERIAARAHGSVRRAIRLAMARGDSDPDREPGRELLLAALADGAVSRYAQALDRRPAGARGKLLDDLDSLALWLRDLAAVAAGAPERVDDPESAAMLTRMVERRNVSAEAAIASLKRVTEARRMAFGNVNPQLILAELLARLQADLVGSAALARTGTL